MVREERAVDFSRLERRFAGRARHEQRLPGAGEIVAQPHVERGAELPTLGRNEPAALAAVDDGHAHLRAGFAEHLAEVAKRQALAAELDGLTIRVSREIEEKNQVCLRLLARPGADTRRNLAQD